MNNIDFIEEFLKYLKDEKNYSEYTCKVYSDDLLQFNAFLNDEHITEVENIDHIIIRQFLALLTDKNYSKRSIARKLAAIKSYFKFLLKMNYIDKNSADYVSTPKLPKLLPHFLYEDEISNIIDSFNENNFESTRDRAIIETLYSTGMRVSELVNLGYQDIDLSQGIARVFGKGKKERIVAIGSKCRESISNYLIYRKALMIKIKIDNEALFLNSRGGRLTDRGVRYIFDKYVKKVAFEKKVSPHTIRHTFATHMLNNGCDLRVVQEFLGHSSLTTTQIYTHIGKKHLKNVYNRYHPHS